jgi:two-component system, response regulator
MTPKHTVLVVEDSDEDFETVLDAARSMGMTCEIRRALNGDEGLQHLQARTAPGAQQHALVLMDLNTPQSDGRDMLRQMQQDERLCAIPVVVLSTSNNPRDVAFCYASGANAFHVKPVQHVAHLAVLTHIFEYWLTRAVLPERRTP